VFDYGHNTSSLLALVETVRQFPHTRRAAVYSAAGDRRDCDLIRQGEILGDAFDRVVLYEDQYLRGRQPGQIMALFQQGLATCRRVAETEQVFGWQKAVDSALARIEPGELLVIQADVVDEAVEYLRRGIPASMTVREIDLQQAIGSRQPQLQAS
jgi:cyanophycin synthetase